MLHGYVLPVTAPSQQGRDRRIRYTRHHHTLAEQRKDKDRPPTTEKGRSKGPLCFLTHRLQSIPGTASAFFAQAELDRKPR
jgi:hypothetical protein